MFALITREIAAAAGEVQAGIEAACRWVAENLPLYAINLVLTAADELWALRYPATHPLYVLQREPGKALEHSSSLGARVRCAEGSSRPFVVVASERLDADPGWGELRPGELLHVDGSLQLRRRTILAGPPAHPLGLEQLGEQARASQARAAPRP